MFLNNKIRYCLWRFLVYDSPQQHPRISDNEKNYIMDNISKSVDEEKTEIPWKSIFLSGPIWITIAAHWSSAWGFLTLMTQAPTYFNFLHGWDINTVSYTFHIHNLIIEQNYVSIIILNQYILIAIIVIFSYGWERDIYRSICIHIHI